MREKSREAECSCEVLKKKFMNEKNLVDQHKRKQQSDLNLEVFKNFFCSFYFVD